MFGSTSVDRPPRDGRHPARFSPLLDLGPVAMLAIVALFVVRDARFAGDYAALLLVVVPLLGRRFWPTASLALVAVAVVLTASRIGDPVVQVAATAIAAEAVGQYSSDRTRSAIVVLATAALMAVGFLVQDADPVLSVILPFVIAAPSWIVGDTIRTRRLEALIRAEAAERELREREARLQTAVAEERRHVARELHDVVAHSVSVMLIQAGAARQVVRSAPEAAETSLLAVEATGREAMAELRRLLGVLGDDSVDSSVEAGGLAPQPGVGQKASGREYVAISPAARKEMAPASCKTAHRPPSMRGNWAWASSWARESKRYASSAPVRSANATPWTAPATQMSANPGA